MDSDNRRSINVKVPVLINGQKHLSAALQEKGGWVFEDGVLSARDETPGINLNESLGTCWLPEVRLSDFVFSLEFYTEETGSQIGLPVIYFQCPDSRSGYFVQLFCWDFVKVDLFSFRQDRFPLELMSAIPADSCALKTWHKLIVTCKGEEKSIFLDGKRILSVNSGLFDKGCIGLGCNTRKVLYRNLEISGDMTADAGWHHEPVPRKYSVVCSDAGGGNFSRFPGVCRLKNGDILAVFAAAYTHVSRPVPEYPRGGAVAFCRSKDHGLTWGRPQTIIDTIYDDRDPGIWQTDDGTVYVICPSIDWSAPDQDGKICNVCCSTRVKSIDNGHSWLAPEDVVWGEYRNWDPWTNPRRLGDGTWIQPIYCGNPRTARGGISAGVAFSRDGHSWSRARLIDPNHWDSDEPDIAVLPNGRVLCLARPVKARHMWQAWSDDNGLNWSGWEPFWYYGHSPNLLFTSAGILLLAMRGLTTAVMFSRDYGKTWSRPAMLDSCPGAYPDMVELPDGRILTVYYTDSKKSEVRAVSFRVTEEGIIPG